MAWPADQNNLYYSGSHSAAPLPQLPDIDWELDLAMDNMHPGSCCLSCLAILAIPFNPQSVVPGPNPTRSVSASSPKGNIQAQAPQTSEYVNVYICLCCVTYPSTKLLHSQPAGQGASQQCKWEGCGKSIKRKNDLMRHIRECHVAPNAFPYPFENCTHAASRKYNLQKHMENHHR